MKDKMGGRIYVGAQVAFAVRQGSRALLQTGNVSSLSEGSKLGDFVHIRTAGGRDTSKTPEEVIVLAAEEVPGVEPTKAKAKKAAK